MSDYYKLQVTKTEIDWDFVFRPEKSDEFHKSYRECVRLIGPNKDNTFLYCIIFGEKRKYKEDQNILTKKVLFFAILHADMGKFLEEYSPISKEEGENIFNIFLNDK